MTPTAVLTIQSFIYDPPTQLAPMVGRERESAMVEDLLLDDNARPVTLTGIGGIGKTRLALHVARRLTDHFADGVCFVELSPTTDVGAGLHTNSERIVTLVASTIAQTLGVTEQPGKTLTDTLKKHLFNKHLLLVLDGFERVLEAAFLIDDLLSAAPQVKMLVTSRVSLGLDSEQERIVLPLDVPAAVRPQFTGNGRLARLTQNESVNLFVQQAQAVNPDFSLNEKNAAAVVSICRRLHGLPLAIELAAARAATSSPQELLSSLPRRGAINRAQASHASSTSPAIDNTKAADSKALADTLRGVVDWSYNQLTGEEKQLFRCVSVFTGGFTLEAAELVCASQLEDQLEAISQIGLVRPDPGIVQLKDWNVPKPVLERSEGSQRSNSFTMPGAVREYAIEQLEACGDEAQLRRGHAMYYATLAQEAELHLRGPHSVEWLVRLDEALPNLRAALRWAEDNVQGREMAVRLSTALGLVWGISQRLSEERMQLAAMMDRARSEDETSDRAAAQANALWAASMRAVAFLAWQRGDYEAAYELDEKNLRTSREMGDNRETALALLNLGNTASKQRDYAKATLHLEESLAFFRELGDKSGLAESLESLALISQEKGDLETARMFHQESLALRRELGYQGGIAASLLNLGEIERALGDYALAGALYRQSLEIYQTTHWGGAAAALHNLGQVALHTGEIARARELFEESLALFSRLGFALGVASSLAGLAGIESQHGEPLRAGKLLAASFAIIEAEGDNWSSIDSLEYNRSLSLACAQVDGAAWQAAWDEGHAMSMDDAIVYALER